MSRFLSAELAVRSRRAFPLKLLAASLLAALLMFRSTPSDPQMVPPQPDASAPLLRVAADASTAPGATSANPGNPPARPALVVTAITPQRSELPLLLVADGSIAAWQEAVIGAEVSGLRLIEVRAQVGDSVRKGQVLARFADEAVRADLAAADAALAEAQATLAGARADADRARSVQGSGALSAQAVAQYLTAERTAEARVQSALAQQAQQRVRLRNTQVLAPDDGLITARSATLGAVPGNDELFRLLRGHRLEWRARVTAAELGRLKVGMPVTVESPQAGRPGNPPDTLQGRIRVIGPSVDPQSREALVYVDLPDAARPGSPLRMGMFARGRFDLGRSAALTVPETAVVVRDGFHYVYTLDRPAAANGLVPVTQRKVQIGRRLGERVEVTEGLPVDMRLVAASAGFLNPGDWVRVVDDPAPASPAKAASGART